MVIFPEARNFFDTGDRSKVPLFVHSNWQWTTMVERKWKRWSSINITIFTCVRCIKKKNEVTHQNDLIQRSTSRTFLALVSQPRHLRWILNLTRQYKMYTRPHQNDYVSCLLRHIKEPAEKSEEMVGMNSFGIWRQWQVTWLCRTLSWRQRSKVYGKYLKNIFYY